MEEKYKLYDEVTSVIAQNILVEHKRCGKFLLYDFDQTQDADKLYFNITGVISDVNKEYMYLDMPPIQYLKLKWRRRKTRKNLRWFNPIQKRKLSNENKTSVYILMNFICEQLNLEENLFQKINDEYYGWY